MSFFCLYLLLFTNLCPSLWLDSQQEPNQREFFSPEHTGNLQLQRQYTVCIMVRQWLILLQLLRPPALCQH